MPDDPWQEALHEAQRERDFWSQALVPPGSVVVKRDDLERMRDTAHDDERSEIANRYLQDG